MLTFKYCFSFYFYYLYTEYISCPLKTDHAIDVGVLALTKPKLLARLVGYAMAGNHLWSKRSSIYAKLAFI